MTTAWSEMQIVNALNSDGPHTDIILAEVNLLMANGAEILRYIMHNKDLQHISVISKLLSLLVIMYSNSKQPSFI